MNSAAAKILAPQAALIAGLVAAGYAAGFPAPLTAIFAFAAIAVAAVQLLALLRPETARKWGLPVAGACTLATLIGFFDTTYFWSSLFALPPFLLATSIWLVSFQCSDVTTRNRWRGLAMTWAFSGTFIWLGTSYAGNQRPAFYASLPVNVALLIVCKRWFRLRALTVQTVNTAILLLAGLPLASLLISGVGASPGPVDPAGKYFSYEVGTKYPAKYGAWWAYFWQQWAQVAKAILTHDHPAHGLPFRLQPNSRAMLMQSLIAINSQGFRGTNIPAEKGRTYRIVALGESTTFGLTCTATARPWPELLEAMIRDRLKLSRPVEVINAGIPSYDLEHNLTRLPLDILPLKPDMIISYHGVNGFRFIDSALPTLYGPAPPEYRARPVELLAAAEFKVRTMLYDRQLAAGLPAASALATNLMTSRYAADYIRLIQVARTNGVRLVLANYSMAVNSRSDPKVIGFYGQTTRKIGWTIRANEAHSALVEELARENPEVTFVDTRPKLDGKYDDYIDLVHFSEDGEHVMAGTMFDGIRNILERDVSPASDLPNQP